MIIVSEFSVKPSAALLIKILLQRGCCDEHKSVAEKDGGVGEDRFPRDDMPLMTQSELVISKHPEKNAVST